MNFTLLGTEGMSEKPIVPADYPYTSHRTTNFQATPPEVVALHRLRANARAWVGRADHGRAKRPQEQRDDDYPLNPGYYGSRAYYHSRDVVPHLGDVRTYTNPNRSYNPETPHRGSYPLYGDGSIFPFTDKHQENFSECPAALPPTHTPAQQQWPHYQNISAYDYDQQAREHLQRSNNRLSFIASSGPNNHAAADARNIGNTRYPKRVLDGRHILGPNIPASVLSGQPGPLDVSDYRPMYSHRPSRPVTAPIPWTAGRFSKKEDGQSLHDRMLQPSYTHLHQH